MDCVIKGRFPKGRAKEESTSLFILALSCQVYHLLEKNKKFGIRVPRSCCYAITRYHGRLHSAERLEYLNIPEAEYSRATDRSAVVQSILSTDFFRYSRSFHVQPLRD